jgi:hypothetical protein
MARAPSVAAPPDGQPLRWAASPPPRRPIVAGPEKLGAVEQGKRLYPMNDITAVAAAAR